MDLNDSSIKYICDSMRDSRDDGLLVVDRLNPNHDFTIDYFNNDYRECKPLVNKNII